MLHLILFVVKWISTFLLLGYYAYAFAQSDSTLFLNEVQVYGMPVTKYAPGGKTEHLRVQHNGTLTDVLAQQTPLYFKIYGNGQLATVAFRGTSASQTAVLWNGINVNSPTLGQTDFSLWPTFLLEEITLQYGTASALYGTDALGGSVLLNAGTPAFTGKNNFQLQQEAGSFGHWLTGVKATYGTQKTELRSKAYHRQLKNDFEFTSPKVGFTKKQQFASTESYGFDQQVFWKIAQAGELSVHGQYAHNFREVQPTVTSNNAGDVLQDNNTRLAAMYRHENLEGSLFATVGYVINDQLYNRTSRTRSDQLTALLQYDFALGKRSSMRTGVNWTRYDARSDGYGHRLHDNRYDGFVSFRHRVSPVWLLSLNARQSVYQNSAAPFSPSWGNEFILKKNDGLKLTLRTQLGRGYRVPTLNDRYWVPGGNPDLRAENGLQAETGMLFTKKNDATEFSFDVTHHRLWINDWIAWLPNNSGLWTPSNLSKVQVSGMESQISYRINRTIYKWHLGATYAYTRSLNKKGLNAYDVATINKQLPYVPIHAARTFAKISCKTWIAEVNTEFNSLRYTTLDNAAHQTLEAYALLSVSAGKSLQIKKTETSIRLQINNLLNTYYETIESRAMPGRNFLTTFIVKF
ncbi:MAG: TonB-dependent receptor [Cyclobacteriaceae bacterium]|nr:TonB-dependent receptor [Cyclobacteriaceae bacterium]